MPSGTPQPPQAVLLQPPSLAPVRQCGWGAHRQQAPGVTLQGGTCGKSLPHLTSSLPESSGVGLNDCTRKVPGPGQPGETARFFPAMLPAGHGSSHDAQASWWSPCRARRPWGAAPSAGRGRYCSSGALEPGPLSFPLFLGRCLMGSCRSAAQVRGPVGARPTPGPASGPRPVSAGPKQPPATCPRPEAATHGAPGPRAAAPVLLCATWGPSPRSGKTPSACSGSGLCCFLTYSVL